jgi:hypothetical protein
MKVKSTNSKFRFKGELYEIDQECDLPKNIIECLEKAGIKFNKVSKPKKAGKKK